MPRINKLFIAFFIFVNHTWGQTLIEVDHFIDSSGIVPPSNHSTKTGEDREGPYFVPLKFHVVKDGSSWYQDTSRIDSLIIQANSYFSSIDIYFYKCGSVNLIHDDVLANDVLPLTIMTELHDDHGRENAINVYIPNSTIGYDGYSYSGPFGDTLYVSSYNGLVISGTESITNKPSIFIHELGHYFGLYHTDAGWGDGLELADGSNCETAGDFCCDTPAEYSTSCCRIASCEYDPLWGHTIDANGDTLHPDVTNIMCIMPYDGMCPDHLTNDQKERMLFYYETYLLDDLNCPGAPVASLNELEAETISIYHDHINQNATIQFSNLSSTYTISLFEISGKLIFTLAEQTNLSYTLNLGELRSGIYLFSVIIEEQKKAFKLFIP